MTGSSLAQVKGSFVTSPSLSRPKAYQTQSTVRQAVYFPTRSGKSGVQHSAAIHSRSDLSLRSFRRHLTLAVPNVQYVESRKQGFIESIQKPSPSLAPPSPRGFRKREVDYPVSTEEPPLRRRAVENSRPVHTRATAQVNNANAKSKSCASNCLEHTISGDPGPAS